MDLFNRWILDKQSQLPLYLQLYHQLREAILRGDLGSQRLPPSRELASKLGVARITVSQAYDQLESEGFVVRRRGAGTFIAPHVTFSVATQAEARPFQPNFSAWGKRVQQTAVSPSGNSPRPEIDFGFGRSFPHIFPYDIWRKLLARYLSTDDAMLSRSGSVAGFYPLREALANYLTRWRGVTCQTEQVVIVNGAQQALDILARLLLEPGDEVLVETPGYSDAFSIFQLHGACLTAVPVDESGFVVEKIPTHSRAKMAFVTPSNQFPQGGTLPLDRRLALLRWAQQHDVLIIEDDYDGELRYDGRPLTALQGLGMADRVIYLGTFSKVLFPALRLSYVVLPEALVRPFVQAKQLIDRGAPTLTQAAVADFMVEGHFERHLRHLREAYGQRRQMLVAALQTHLPNLVRYADEPAGLHVMLYLPTHLQETAVVQAAAEGGVGVYPAAPYFMTPSPPAILLGFSGLSETEIAQGVARLGDVMTALMNGEN